MISLWFLIQYLMYDWFFTIKLIKQQTWIKAASVFIFEFWIIWQLTINRRMISLFRHFYSSHSSFSMVNDSYNNFLFLAGALSILWLFCLFVCLNLNTLPSLVPPGNNNDTIKSLKNVKVSKTAFFSRAIIKWNYCSYIKLSNILYSSVKLHFGCNNESICLTNRYSNLILLIRLNCFMSWMIINFQMKCKLYKKV